MSEQLVGKASEAMTAGNWHQASVLLTKALLLEPENPVLLCMRAGARAQTMADLSFSAHICYCSSYCFPPSRVPIKPLSTALASLPVLALSFQIGAFSHSLDRPSVPFPRRAHVRGLTVTADCFTKLCFFESALLDTSNALKLQPDNVEALLCKADAYASINEVDVALRLYLHAYEEQAEQRQPEPWNGNLQQQLHKVRRLAFRRQCCRFFTSFVRSSLIRSEHAMKRESFVGCKGCKSTGALGL
jgi:tetratricopeptide (TPR) repeat protein